MAPGQKEPNIDSNERGAALEGALERLEIEKARLQDAVEQHEREQRRAREVEQRYHSLAAAIASVIWTAAPDGNFVHAQPAWESFTGQPWSQHRDWGWLDALHPDEHAGARSELSAALKAGRLHQSEARVWHANSAAYHVCLLRAAPVRGENGAIREWIGTLTDIDERRRAEHARQESESRLRDALVAGRALTFEWDVLTDRVRRSDNVAEILGIGLNEAPAAQDFMKLVHPADRERLLHEIQQTTPRLSNYELEYRVIKPDGAVIWAQERGRAAFDEQGRMARLQGVLVDITERKRLEEQLLAVQRLETVGRLASGVAHDFNNALTGILGYVELAQLPGARPEEIRDLLSRIRDAGQRAAGLTSQLLAFARKQIVRLRVIDCNHALSELETLLRRLLGEDIDLVLHVEPRLWAVEIDPAQFEQLVVQLAVHAREAMPLGGQLTIETQNVTLDELAARRRPGLNAGEHVRLSIRDTGPGIDPAVQPHIFEPFFTTQAGGHSEGLGLATCYGIVKQNHGHIGLQSEPGLGTTFEVFLPRSPEAVSDATIGESSEPPTGQETILVVEDDPHVLEVAVRALRGQGYTVLPATCGEEAVRLLEQQQEPIDLLLTDVVMPRMSGPELADHLRSSGLDLRVLYTSAYAEHTVNRHGVAGSSVAFLAKPYTPSALCQRVREVLSSPRRGSA